MKKFLLYGHGGAYNHGAEAIVQTTARIIRECYPDAQIILSTHFKEQDLEFKLPVDKIIEKDNYYFELDKQCEKKGTYNTQIYSKALEEIDEETVCLSIGGDNYCYGIEHRLYTFHQEAVNKGAKSILWGCSIEPGLISEEMLKNLRTHDCIITRESVTYNALIKEGLTNVELAPDPAFTLEPQQVQLPDIFEENEVIGINVSPLVVRKESKEGIVIENIKRLIEFITLELNVVVALIPHVMMRMDSDYTLLKSIYDNLDDVIKAKIILIDDNFSASQYKYIVSRCKYIVTARTHVAIAGYSTCVPTLSIGYSVKAIGLTKDIMKSDMRYNIGIEEMNQKDALINRFKLLLQEQDEMRKHLQEIMPSYKENAKGLKTILADIVGD